MQEKTNNLPDLFVFHRTIDQDMECVEGGVKGVVVDLEFRGKTSRQENFDTEINTHSIENISHLKKRNAYVICRSNSIEKNSEDELKQIIDNGADEILLPMIKSVEEVEYALRIVNDQTKVGAMIETPEAIRLADQLDKLNLSRFFIGLNDLRIARGENSIFHPFSKGIVQDIRDKVKNTALGFGGLTIPNHGSPLPVDFFCQEIMRLLCEFTFLRRSFLKDIEGKSRIEGIREIIKSLERKQQRSADEVERDFDLLKEKLESIVETYEG